MADEVAVTREDDLETASAPADGPWAFDEAVTVSFEDMLARSIPQYENMRRFVTEAACYALLRAKASPIIVDLGASRGSALAPIVDRMGTGSRYVAVEISEPMIAALEDRFKHWIGPGRRMDILRHDLRDGFPPKQIVPATVILSVLTLQFVPIEYRQALLRGIYENLRPGGIFILVEKVLGATAEIQDLMVEVYHDHKAEHGYSREAIDRKRLSLEGVLVPLTARFNEELVLAAGFDAVDCCLAWGSFRGWVCLKR